MDKLCVIAESDLALRDLHTRIAGVFDTRFFRLDQIPDAAPGQYTLVDVDLRKPGRCTGLREWLKRRPRDAQTIFAVRRDSHAEAVQAHALGATGLIARPVTGDGLRSKLDEANRAFASIAEGFDAEGLAGVGASAAALSDLFEAALNGHPIDAQTVGAAAEAVVSTIEEDGLTRWVDVVRRHHSQTYQHCLLVTGVAVGFAKKLGFRRADKDRLATAGLLHDIGKAKIPLQILEKQGPLDPVELTVMREHPLLGLEALEAAPALQPEMIDMVAHHHEFLDGSGYPHGLMGGSIADLVRTITISDIYGALIERRSYKPPLPPEDAYGILLNMNGKLDKDLLREFRAIVRA